MTAAVMAADASYDPGKTNYKLNKTNYLENLTYWNWIFHYNFTIKWHPFRSCIQLNKHHNDFLQYI